jgi:hypothetical protein
LHHPPQLCSFIFFVNQISKKVIHETNKNAKQKIIIKKQQGTKTKSNQELRLVQNTKKLSPFLLHEPSISSPQTQIIMSGSIPSIMVNINQNAGKNNNNDLP